MVRHIFHVALVATVLGHPRAAVADNGLRTTFQQSVEPILVKRCYDCHGEGSNRGEVALDGFGTETSLRDPQLWLRVLKAVRLGMMPPASEERMTSAETEALIGWIKRQAWSLDPQHPDPGQVTLRRLNRVEYRNTIRDLLGVDFDTKNEFPADDSGHGFDNIGDVLTLSPMLLEKYLDAAQAVVTRAVPTRNRQIGETVIQGQGFRPSASKIIAATATKGVVSTAPPGTQDLPYYTAAKVTARHHARKAGRYQLVGEVRPVERFADEPDSNRCRVRFVVDNRVVWEREFAREIDQTYTFTAEQSWAAGPHKLAFELEPLAPASEQRRVLRLRLNAVTVRGPLDETDWVQPPQYARFFPRSVPANPQAKEAYARQLLRKFATRAFRQPVAPETVDDLVKLATFTALTPNANFESGIAQAMVAVLASPRFVFRDEASLPLLPGQRYPLIDEYALASRLSYFLWSSMPDDELFRLAKRNRLRRQLKQQFKRMLADPRADEFVRNFAGQWLLARDITDVDIDAKAIYLRDHSDSEAQARAATPQLTTGLRKAMQAETEMSFAHLLKQNRSLLELIDSNHTFVNEELANHYGIPGVQGPHLRKVTLPANSPRGGVLTQGTVLAVTSNPTRTSPVKRGVFILNAILGTPPAPPPPNIPSLDDVISKEDQHKLSLRQALDMHANNALCRSCHNRMDPLGLALENFNAMGAWRDTDINVPIDPAGTLVTGESFTNISELKRVLAHERKRDFFYNVVEKLLTYALGRGMQHTDVDTIDALVAVLDKAQGRPQPLLAAIVASAPFQSRRAKAQP